MPDLMMFIHNLICHPVMAILQVLGFDRAAVAVHNVTIPRAPSLEEQGIDSAVIEITREQVAIGMSYAELLALSDHKATIARQETYSPETKSTKRSWVVSYWCSGEWHQAQADTLSEAIDAAVDAQVDRLLKGYHD
jgi:hypothetical protein